MTTLTSPHWSRVALITIDVQRDTLDGAPLEIPGTTAALPAIQRLAQVFRECHKPIVHVVRLYKADGSNVDLCRRRAVQGGARMLLPDSDGSQLAKELLPLPDTRLDVDLLLAGGIQNLDVSESVAYKPRWGAFFATPLHAYLQKHGVDTLVFAGCNFPNCPRTSIYEASERDYRLVLATDAVSGCYDRGKAELENIGVELMESGDIAEHVRLGNKDNPLAESGLQ
ncbi:MAG: cysteine hydrolase [Planctomycetota bacterium]|nr:cysteine hydrolase [Planctomycetota bacterium]